MKLFLYKILDSIDKLLVAVMFSLIFVTPVFGATEMCATGFGSSSYNDTYVYSDDTNSRPRYQTATLQMCYEGTHWQIHPIGVCDGGADVAYYDIDNGSWAEPDEVPSWEIGVGDSPAGSVVDCSTSEPPATTTPGTYDGANFQEWLFVSGVGLFFISFIGWRFMFGQITLSKK
jgi:hypothetical protein